MRQRPRSSSVRDRPTIGDLTDMGCEVVRALAEEEGWQARRDDWLAGCPEDMPTLLREPLYRSTLNTLTAASLSAIEALRIKNPAICQDSPRTLVDFMKIVEVCTACIATIAAADDTLEQVSEYCAPLFKLLSKKQEFAGVFGYNHITRASNTAFHAKTMAAVKTAAAYSGSFLPADLFLAVSEYKDKNWVVPILVRACMTAFYGSEIALRMHSAAEFRKAGKDTGGRASKGGLSGVSLCDAAIAFRELCDMLKVHPLEVRTILESYCSHSLPLCSCDC